MADIAGAISAVTAAVGLLKEMNQVDREFDKASLKLKIAELSGAVATAQIALAEAQKELNEKDARIAALERRFKEKGDNLVEFHGHLYRKKADGKPQGRPYCPNCAPNGDFIMAVHTNKPGRSLECPSCGTDFRATEFFFEGE